MNIGIVGLGHLGKIHIKLLKELNAFNVSTVFDIDKDIMSACGSQYYIKTASTYEEFLTHCDAVCVVTPTPTHYDLASKAIKQGKHVFIEKPATDAIDDIKKLIKLTREANVKVQVGHVERFNPAFIAAEKYIQQPFLFEVHRLACYNKRGTDVSVVLDLMIHDIDLILSIVKSKIKRISATGTNVVSKTADLVNARIEFENGCTANLTANRVATSNVRKIRAFQKDTCVHIDLLNKLATVNHIAPLISNQKNNPIVIDTGEGNQMYGIHQSQPMIESGNALKTELEHFYNSITQNMPVPVSLLDAENALHVAKEIESLIKH